MALREIYDFSEVILMSKLGERSNSGNTTQKFVLGITEMHPPNQPGAAKEVCVGINKIFGEQELARKCWPTPSTPWDQAVGHLSLISFALCSGYAHQVKQDVRSTMAWRVQVTSLDTWQALLAACPHLLVQRERDEALCHLPISAQ